MSSCFNGDRHNRRLELIAALLAMLACGTAKAQHGDSIEPIMSAAEGRVYTGSTPLRLWHQTRGYGMEASQTAFGGRLAVDLADAVGFLDGQFRVTNESQFGMDVGGGFRWMTDGFLTGDPRILGVTGWYDGQETILDNYFNQLGVSFESLGEFVDLRLNANIPLEDQKNGDTVFVTEDFNFTGNSLALATIVPADVALRVVDFEVATRVLDLNAWVYGGGYQMDGDGVSEMGGKGGVRGYVTNDLAVDVGVQDDELFGTNTVFQIIWMPGRTGAGPTSWIHNLADRMREPVYRNSYIATNQVETTGSSVLTDETGGELRFVHVDSNAAGTGDGSFENPYTSLDSVNGGSQQGDIVLVHAESVHNGQSVTLKDAQRLLGEGDGNTHLVNTSQLGEIVIPETSPGALSAARPLIQNAPGTAIILAGGNVEVETLPEIEISNFDIEGGASAITSPTGVGDVNINRLAISDTTGNAIDLTPLSETLANNTTQLRFTPTIDEVTFDNIGGDDIELGADAAPAAGTTIMEAIAVSDITSTNGNGVGIELLNTQRAATISDVDWDGGTTGEGGLRIASAGSQGAVTLNGTNTFTGGQTGTPDAAGFAIALVDSAATHTVTGTTITDMGGDSIIVEGGAANLNFTGTIAQNASNASVLSVTDGHTGALTFTELAANAGLVEASTGDGLQFNNADGVYTFNDLVELTGTSMGVNVVGGSEAVITLADAQITDTTGVAMNFDGGEANMTLTGNIQQTANAQAVLTVSNGHTGTLVFNEGDAGAGVINATNGTGLQFNNADGAYTFNDEVALNGGDAGIDVLAGSEGTFTFADADIDYSGGGIALNIDNSDVQAFTISGDIDSTDGRPVAITNNDGGSITINATVDSGDEGILVSGNTDTTIRFAGQTTLNTAANRGVDLADNANGGVRFDALDITTTTGDGFVADNTDNLTVQGSGNTIATTSGEALSLTDVEVGAAGVTFQSVTTAGGTNGILLDNVTGGTVTVNGGTITGTSGAGVSVLGGANLSLNGMSISATSGDGVNIDLTNNVASNISVNNTTITGATGLGIDYNRGSAVGTTTRLTLTGNTIDNTSEQAVGIDVNGTSTANVSIIGSNQFSNASGDEALLVNTSGGSGKTLNLLIDGGTFQNDAAIPAASITANGAGTVNANVTDNSFMNSEPATGRAFAASTNSLSTTLRLNLDSNNATSGDATGDYLLDNNSGTFRVEDVATVNGRNNGLILQEGTISNDNGPIPTP